MHETMKTRPQATNPGKQKCVFVLDEALSPGQAANAAAVLAGALFREVDGLLGPEVPDADGRIHAAITRFNLPVLRAGAERLCELETAVRADERLVLADFPHPARTARQYEDYAARLAECGAGELRYAGLAIFGPAKAVNRLTGNLECL